MLRLRCDACGFKPLTIEIIARQKVAPAFEPQKLSWRTAASGLRRAPHDEKRSQRRRPSRACNLLFGNLGPAAFSLRLSIAFENLRYAMLAGWLTERLGLFEVFD